MEVEGSAEANPALEKDNGATAATPGVIGSIVDDASPAAAPTSIGVVEPDPLAACMVVMDRLRERARVDKAIALPIPPQVAAPIDSGMEMGTDVEAVDGEDMDSMEN